MYLVNALFKPYISKYEFDGKITSYNEFQRGVQISWVLCHEIWTQGSTSHGDPFRATLKAPETTTTMKNWEKN